MSSIVDIDPDGDLVLIVGSPDATVARFRVSRFALRLASPVWKAMFCGSFAEATAQEVKMPADEPEAMRYVLLNVHLQFRKLPTSLRLKEIAQLAELCDKYDCISVVEDRMLSLLSKYDENGIKSVQAAGHWMWIGWTLCKQSWFVKGLMFVVANSTVTRVTAMELLPPGSKDFLLEYLSHAHVRLLRVVYRLIENDRDGPAVCQKTCSYNVQSRCHYIQVGLVCKVFARLGLSVHQLLPTNQPEMTMSLQELQAFVSESRGVADKAVDPHYGHDACFAQNFKEVETTLRSVLAKVSVLTGEIKAHFAVQA